MPFSSSVPMLSSLTRGLAIREHGPRIGRSHHRELDQVLGVALGVGAKVEHHAIGVAERRQQGGEAGRSIPGMVRSASLAMAISAPVLPPESAA